AQRPAQQPAGEHDRNEDDDARPAPEVAEGQADQRRRERAKAVQSNDISKDADDQGTDRQEQQDFNTPLLRPGKLLERRGAAEPLAPARRGGVRGGEGHPLDQERVLDVADILAADQLLIAVREDDVVWRRVAEVMVRRARGEPAAVGPDLDPRMRRLLLAVAEDEAGEEASRQPAVAAQRRQQAAARGRVAAAAAQAVEGRARAAGDGRLRIDLFDVLVQRLRQIAAAPAGLSDLPGDLRNLRVIDVDAGLAAQILAL